MLFAILTTYPPCHYVGLIGVAFVVTVLALIGSIPLAGLHHSLNNAKSRMASAFAGIGVALIFGDIWWNLEGMIIKPSLFFGFGIILVACIALYIVSHKFLYDKTSC